MFDASNVMLQGINLIALVFGLVEFIKTVGNLSGKVVTIISACLGAVIMTVYQLIPLLGQPYEQIVTIVFTSITFGLAASGFYKYVKASQVAANAARRAG